MNIFGMGMTELLAVLVVSLLVLGPTKMVDTAKTLGKYFRELQKATSEIPRLLTMEDEQTKTANDQSQQPPEDVLKNPEIPSVESPAQEDEN
jgi:sec-independent protein translocase protein TatA